MSDNDGSGDASGSQYEDNDGGDQEQSVVSGPSRFYRGASIGASAGAAGGYHFPSVASHQLGP